MSEFDEITKEVSKEIAKEVYIDGGKPIVKPTAECISLIPRTIKAMLEPLEKWILNKEYNIQETKKLLAIKLENVSIDNIVTPEPHIAVPALQYISYCIDNEELRNMYANLLANSMNKVVKNGVHPSFVEIIKQLCPDEAKILRYFSIFHTIPTVTLRRENEEKAGLDVYKNFSNIGELTNCEAPYETNKYFDNLIRLGLTVSSPIFASLTDKNSYTPLKEHNHLKSIIETTKLDNEFNKVNYVEGFIQLTDFGKNFCKICIGNPINVINIFK